MAVTGEHAEGYARYEPGGLAHRMETALTMWTAVAALESGAFELLQGTEFEGQLNPDLELLEAAVESAIGDEDDAIKGGQKE